MRIDSRMMTQYSIQTQGAWEPYNRREWLLTNGTGSFASGTVAGCNTRRYHSLLCAAMRPPAARHVMLSRLGESVQLNNTGTIYELSVNHFQNGLHPKGYQHLVTFEMGETAKWIYRVADTEIEKEVLLCWRRNLTGIRYTIRPGGQAVKMEIMPFVAMRDYHALRHGTEAQFQLQSWGKHATITDATLCLHLASDLAQWVEKPYWWYAHVYPVEAFRGLDYLEELWNPGRFEIQTKANEAVSFVIWASAEHVDMRRLGPTGQSPRRREPSRHRQHAQASESAPPAALASFGCISGCQATPRPGNVQDNYCGVPMVHGLGPRHDDLPARPASVHRAI